MSTSKDIEFHIEETWRIDFTTHNSDGSVLSLAGASVQFRLNEGSTVKFTKTIGDGITITDEAAGAGYVTITPAEQVAATIKKGKSYPYELKYIGSFVSVQCIGNLKALPSLFATPIAA